MTAFTALAWKRTSDVAWNDAQRRRQRWRRAIEQQRRQAARAVAQLLGYRGSRVQMRLSYTGGWADANIPQDFAWYVQRLCWVEFKKRETAEVGKTAIPEMGIVIVPQAWPTDVKAGLSSYRRVVLT
jgi:hypothetical protein